MANTRVGVGSVWTGPDGQGAGAQGGIVGRVRLVGMQG